MREKKVRMTDEMIAQLEELQGHATFSGAARSAIRAGLDSMRRSERPAYGECAECLGCGFLQIPDPSTGCPVVIECEHCDGAGGFWG